jgi:hypothetical protein
MFGGKRVNEYWIKRYIKELTKLFGDPDMLSFASISRLNWIGHVNGMDSKRKVSNVHNNNPQGSRIRRRLKKQMVELCTNRY